MRAAGHPHAYPYLPWSASYGWAANWTGTRPDALPAGLIGWQYEGNTGGRGYDLSVFDAALIGDTMEAADVWNVRFQKDGQGENYRAISWLIGADQAARQAVADVATLTEKVDALTAAVHTLAGKVTPGATGGLTARQVAEGLGAALTAGAPKA
jgi:hypothetical protein